MGPRPRNPGRRKLPDYLRERKDRRTGRTYYAYHAPDGREYGLGSDKGYAIQQAIDANLRRTQAPPDLWARISGTRTVADWIPEYRKVLDEQKLAANTRRSAEVYVRRAEAEFGRMAIEEVTTKHVADLLREYTDADKRRSANACRARLHDLFRAAEAAGWIDRGTNPVDVIRQIKAEVKRERLTLEAFREIYEAAAKLDPWVQRSMELALVTAQRREDLARLQFSAVSDGHLHVVQGKTGNRVRIPAALRVGAMGWSLESVISRCRDTVLSRHLLHHTKRRTKSKPGDAVHIDTISRQFAAARALTKLTWEKAPPTFHEIRSLAERLYDDQGINTQALLGHRDPRSTAIYKDRRGSEWIEVKA